jgi:hypothetical protein
MWSGVVPEIRRHLDIPACVCHRVSQQARHRLCQQGRAQGRMRLCGGHRLAQRTQPGPRRSGGRGGGSGLAGGASTRRQ